MNIREPFLIDTVREDGDSVIVDVGVGKPVRFIWCWPVPLTP